MIECPNCGMDNAPDRAFCRICGERLPQQTPIPGDSNGGTQGGALGLDWLLAGEEVVDSPEATSPPLDAAEESALSVPAEVSEGSLTQEPEESGRVALSSAFLPAWLQGVEVEAEVAEPPTPLWDEELDFSNLPDWPMEEDEAKVPTTQPSDIPEWASFELDDPIQSPEREGSGLLAGVRGPIPIEPVIALLHEAPAFPGRDEVPVNQEAANLFARIAGGAVAPEPIVLPQAPLRGAAIFHLILLLSIILPLIFRDTLIFGAPPRVAAATSFGDTLRALPPDSTVLISFDYEAGMRDELEPAAIATLNHLHALSQSAEGEERTVRLIAVSTTTQGAALAEEAKRKSIWENEAWLNMGFLPGGNVGVRDVLLQPFASGEGQPEIRQRAQAALEHLALIVVIGSDTTVVQRWIEQGGIQEPELPMLAIAPSVAESTLTPYLASGQLDGLLSGIPSTASYEFYDLNQFEALRPRLIAWYRIDALTVAALLSLIVILAGNLIGSGRVDLERFRRNRPEEEE